MILRKGKTGTPLAPKSRTSSVEIERQAKEKCKKNELNCGTLATLVEPEKLVLQLSPGLTLEISWQSGNFKRFYRFEIVCL